jgi:hypothetical protein
MLVNFLNKGMRHAWEASNWIDICPYGEVRFPQNLVGDPNLTQGGAYASSSVNTTITAAAFNNPLDNRTTAASAYETAANAMHTVAFANAGQTTIYANPGQSYTFSGYARPNGRTWVQVSVNDQGSGFASAFFNLVVNSPVVGTTSSNLFQSIQTAVQQSGNGFFLWSLNFTASSTSNSFAAPTIALSPDGVTTSYAGNTSDGIFTWGNTFYLQQNITPASYLVPYSQLGEQPIDSTSVFDIWATDPGSGFVPARVNYNILPGGLEIVGPSSIGPLYMWYRPQAPVLTATAFNPATAYVSGQSFQYTSVLQLTSGTTQCYTVNSAGTSAGQTPDTNPSLFTQTYIPYIFSSFMEWDAYSNWLLAEGQAAKAQAIKAVAASFLDDENDKQERQAGWLMPWRVNTHLTSQDRGMGFQNQNYNLTGTAVYN